jgi:hypothetical protein
MATRFQGTSAGDKGTTYEIHVDDADYGGAVIPVSVGGDGFQLTYTPNREEPDAEILSSSAIVTIESTASNSSDVESFIDDLLTADEDRFKLYIYNSDSSLFWMGYVVPDQTVWQDVDYADLGFSFAIRAVDGINRLKSIKYDDSSALAEENYRELVRIHLVNILDHIGLLDYYGATDVCLRVIMRWYEERMKDLALSTCLVDRTYIDHRAFITGYKEDTNEYMSAYDVLIEIMSFLLCRFYFSDGVYRVDQINEYRENGDIYVHKYYKDGTKPGTDTSVDLRIIEDSDDGIRLAQGKYSAFAACRRIELAYKSLNDENLLEGRQFNTLNSSEKALGRVFNADGNWLNIKGTLTHTAIMDNNAGGQLAFAMRVRVVVDGSTSHYLKRNYTLENGTVVFTEVTWETSVNDYFIVANPNISDGFWVDTVLDINTPELPASTADHYIYVSFDYSATLFSTSSSEQWNWQLPILRLKNENADNLVREKEYELENSNLLNASLVIDREHILGDGDSFSGSRAITVLNTSDIQIASQDWIKGVTPGADYLIQELYMRELMKIRRAPLLKWEGQIYSADYRAHNIYQFSTTNAKYSLLRGTYNAARETWNGLWFYNAYGDPAIADAVIIKYPPNPDPITGPGGLPTFPGETTNPEGGATGGPSILVGEIDADVADGTITSLPITPLGTNGLINDNDTIAVYDPYTGATEVFTVNGDVGASDTTITVDSTVTDSDLSSGSYIYAPTSQYVNNIQTGAATTVTRYVQVFTSTGSSTLTVTENGGTLPASTDLIDVIDGGFELIHGDGFTVSGSDIVLSYTPRTGSKIKVKFWIID